VQDPAVDAKPTLPTQEPLTGPLLRPASTCALPLSSTTPGGGAPAGDLTQSAAGLGLPNTARSGADTPVALLAATAAVGMLVRLRMRRQTRDE
jgi:hypothetical protein